MLVPVILITSCSLFALIVMIVYNRLIRLRNEYKNAFSQIDVQLKRRYDLIPNLVETAKAYMKHEMETLEKVIQARNMALSAQKKLGGDPSNQKSLQGLMKAEGELGGLLGRLFALSENYPDLKANQNMLKVQEELSSTENKIAFARQYFNDAVTIYNNGCELFPNNVVASLFNFSKTNLWEISTEERNEKFKVAF